MKRKISNQRNHQRKEQLPPEETRYVSHPQSSDDIHSNKKNASALKDKDAVDHSQSSQPISHHHKSQRKAQPSNKKSLFPVYLSRNRVTLILGSAIIVLLSCYFTTDKLVSIIDLLIDYIDPSPSQDNLPKNIEESIQLKTPPPIFDGLIHLSQDVIELQWMKDIKQIRDLIRYVHPVVIKNYPVKDWNLFQNEWNIANLYDTVPGIILEQTRYQINDPTFILSNERDKGGMLGSKHDRPLAYVNVTLNQFLSSVFDNSTHLYWTGELLEFEQIVRNAKNDRRNVSDESLTKQSTLTGTIDKNYSDGWESFRIIDEGLDDSIGLEKDQHLWTPMLWLSHPGIVSQTHYDTQNNVFLHVHGKKTVQLFPPDSELYSYPNIHRSYRQSQVILSPTEIVESKDEIIETFPIISALSGFEVTLQPGDILYIPPYYQHRVESHGLCVSLSVLSPSTVEAIISEAYWQHVPFGSFQNSSYHRATAAKVYLNEVIKHLKLLNTTIEAFSRKLYHSRFQPLYGIEHLEQVYAMLPTAHTFCGKTADSPSQDLAEEGNIDDLLQQSSISFQNVAQNLASIIESLYSVNSNVSEGKERFQYITSIQETFLKDYFEQLSRWAVGPTLTPLFIFKCLGHIHI